VDESSPWGTAVMLYLDNTSEKDVIVQCDTMTINGFTIAPYFYNQIDKGRKALMPISIFSEDLSANNITEIKDIFFLGVILVYLGGDFHECYANLLFTFRMEMQPVCRYNYILRITALIYIRKSYYSISII
jgi:hypothetical protein